MYQKIILLFTIIATYSSIAWGQNISKKLPLSIPLITTYNPSEYHGGIQNWDVDQDSTGYLYVANNYGLLEFDGAAWYRYEIPNSTKTRTVMVQESTNRIYVGGQRQLGYFQNEISGFKYYNLIPSIPAEIAVDEIWKIVELEGQIFANITGRLATIVGNEISIIENINHIDFIKILDKDLIIGSKDGIYLYEKSTNSFHLNEGSAGYTYKGVAKVNKGFYLFTYEGSVFHLVDQTLENLTPPEIKEYLEEAKINEVLLLSNGNIAIGTQNNGVFILDEALSFVQHLTKNKGLNHRTVLSLYEDNFNNLWVGLNNGICTIELGSPFALINENVGLEGTGYAATDLNSELYLGTSSGLFKQQKSKLINEPRAGYEVIQGTEGLVNNVSTIKDKILLSHHEGSFLLDDNNLIHFYDESGTWAFQMTLDNILLGGTYEGFFLYNMKESQPRVKKLSGLTESSRVFEFANDSILWMTHGYKGAYKLNLIYDSVRSIKHYGIDQGFPSNILISVYKIDDELIFTAEKGIYQYRIEVDSFQLHPFLNEWFHDKHVSKFKQQGSDIYFIADGEIGVLKKESIGIYEEKSKIFKKINKYLSDDLENITILESGLILFGAKEGFVLYRPNLEKTLNESYDSYLKKVTITYSAEESETIMGPYFSSFAIDDPKVIRLEFSAPYFDGLNEIQYSYRLTPYQENWSEWEATNWKEYTNLPPGEYTFEMKSINTYGIESKVSMYGFAIIPQWYETNIAYAAYASFILFVFTTVLLVREKKHKEEKYIIHKSKEEEIRSKEREISEFSEKTNQEIQSLKNQSLKKEIDHKNSQLASVTMHLLSKNEFVMSIRKKITDALEDKNNAESLNKIVKSIDRNTDEDEAWDTFAYHFDQVHGDFLKKIKEEIHLTPQETKLCAYLRMNMSTKDIANLMNITVRGVELGRYRLRKKLNLERDQNLVEYLLRI